MSTFEHTSSIERSSTPRPLYDSQFPAVILLVLSGAVLVAGIVLENYYLLAALPVLLLVCKYPVEMSLGIFAFLIPFGSVLAIGDSGYTVNWVLGAAAGAILFAFGLVNNRLQAPPRITLWWALFILWGGVTLLWAFDPAKGLVRFASAGCLVLLYLVVVGIGIDEREFRTVILFAMAGGVFAAGYTLREFNQGYSFFSRASLIINGQEANPNDLADTLLLPFSLALGWCLSARNMLNRALSLAAGGLIAYCLFLTMSRGSLVALTVLLLVYVVRLRVNIRIVIPIVIISALIVFLPSLFFVRMQDSVASRGQGRWDIFIVTAHIIRQYGVLGAGLESFRAAYTKFAGFAPIFRGFNRDAHNIYLQVWAELGIVGLMLFFAAIWYQLKGLHLAYRERSGSPDYLLIAIEAACCAELVHGFAANILWSKEFWFAWMLAALAVQLRRCSASDERVWTLPQPNWRPPDFDLGRLSR
jgi:O-antigen ligase